MHNIFGIPIEINSYPETEGMWEGPKPWDWDYRRLAHQEWLAKQRLANAYDPNAPTLSWGSEPYKPVTKEGQQVYGPFSKGAGQKSYQKSEPKKSDKEGDWLNQLLMASLMQGQKRQYGKQAGLGYGVGAQVQFGDPYTMRAAWEKDYRNI